MAPPSTRTIKGNLKNIKQLIYASLGIAFLVFSGFVYLSEVPEARTNTAPEQVTAGKMLWQKHNCSSCHQLYGLGGYLGPDLTNTLSEKGRPYAAAIMKTGTRVMPNFDLQETEIEALLAFLEHTDNSGRGSVHDYRVELDGSITPVIKEGAGR